MKDHEAFYKIHHINERFNRIFSVPLFVGSFFVLCFLAVLNYHGRLFIALLINVLFNRPSTYLNYIAKLFAKPIALFQMVVFYFVIAGFYAIVLRAISIFSKIIERSNLNRAEMWNNALPATDHHTEHFQV